MNGYSIAVVSALAMGAVYLMDMVMAGKTYQRSAEPMFVSSVFSFLPAPLLLLLGWQMPDTQAAMMAFAAGVMLMIANWMYFTVIYSDAGECTEMAVYENSSVLVIIAVIWLMSLGGIHMHEAILPRQWIGVVLCSLSLWTLHLWGEKMEHASWKHRILLIGFMIFGASYEMLVDRSIYLATLTEGITTNQQGFVAVAPFFWIGLSIGVVAMLPKGEWKAFHENFPNIRKHWKLIVLMEALAIVAFGAMVYGFAEGHVAAIAMIAGSFPLLVFAGGIVLRRKFGVSEETFPVVLHPWKKGIAVTVAIIGAALSAWGA